MATGIVEVGAEKMKGKRRGKAEEGRKIPHLAPAAELHATPPRGLGMGMGRRAFDLDEGDGLEGFANSPAGEGEGEEGEVEEAVKAEERKGSLLGGLEDEGSGSASGSGDEEEEGVTMGMKGGETKAKGDLQRFWK